VEIVPDPSRLDFALNTADAHGLHKAFGFRRCTDGRETRLDRPAVR
jgi:hypothetical protein